MKKCFNPTAMAGSLVLAAVAGILSLACSQTHADEQTLTPIPYGTEQVINPGDSAAVIVEKAAKVLPPANQTEWMLP